MKNKIAQLTQTQKALNSELSKIKQQLSINQDKLGNQDTDLKKEWFFNGAIVLIIGLVLGLLIPRIPIRKKAAMENWK